MGGDLPSTSFIWCLTSAAADRDDAAFADETACANPHRPSFMTSVSTTATEAR